ncbi:hypothetical protein [Pseudomonas farris]
MFNVITDLKKILQLNKQLVSRLREHLTHVEMRTITSPGGKYDFKVYFDRRTGADSRGWATGKPKPDKLRNYFVFGQPGVDSLVHIAVQINFPATKYSKALAGVFVEDEVGEIYIAHRGKLTGAGGAFKTLQVLDRLPKCIMAMENGRALPLALIGSIDDVTLVSELFIFARECREIVSQLAAERDWGKKSRSKLGSSAKERGEYVSLTPEGERVMRLSDYFDEFAGESTRKAVLAGVRVVRHGTIVSALAKKLKVEGHVRKSLAIDLAVLATEYIDLYEIKTSTSTTDIYTGLGQLLIHGETIEALLQLPVRQHLVLPARPRRSLELPLVGRYKINIITYEKFGGGYNFK